MESLDRFFPNVCELDLIFHYEEVNAILAEVIQGGMVLETNINEIVKQGESESAASNDEPQGCVAALLTLFPLPFHDTQRKPLQKLARLQLLEEVLEREQQE